MRFQLFEFEDLPWFPDSIRQGGTDYLRYLLIATRFYEPVIPLIDDALEQTGETEILDLCSGGGGAMEQISRNLNEYCGREVRITLSDKFPNTNAFEYIKSKTLGNVDYIPSPVDAGNVPNTIKGLRTMFSAVHHFSPGTIKSFIRNSSENNAPIALFDGGDRNPLVILGIILFHPIAFILCTPFFRPFRWSRLMFTYLIPLIPLTTIWDGCISILRLYKPQELFQLAIQTAPGYNWEAGKVKNRLGMNVTYIIGIPKNK